MVAPFVLHEPASLEVAAASAAVVLDTVPVVVGGVALLEPQAASASTSNTTDTLASTAAGRFAIAFPLFVEL